MRYVTSQQAEDFIRRWDEGEWDRGRHRLGNLFYIQYKLDWCCRADHHPGFLQGRNCITEVRCPGKAVKLIRKFFTRG